MRQLNPLLLIFQFIYVCVIGTMPGPFRSPSELKHFVGTLNLSRDVAASLAEVISDDSHVPLSARAQAACQVMTVSSSAEIQESGTEFTVREEENWSQACWLRPTCIVIPKSAVDVASILRVLNFLQVPFAVRSGGHSPNPRWSSITGPGVLVDLSALNELTLNPDKKLIQIGPGLRWAEVYEKLAGTGVTVTGGRVSSVGVGGLILGGGNSFFTNEYGFTCDNVQNYEVVLADSRILNANANENSDLFWALKGGGPNFGIVTKFELDTVPIDEFYYEIIVTAFEDANRVLDALVEFQRHGELDQKASLIFVGTPTGVTLVLVYSQPAATRPAAFNAFKDVPVIQFLCLPTNGTQSSLLTLLNQFTPAGKERHDYRAASSQIDGQLYKDAYAYYVEQANNISKSKAANISFTIQTVSESATRRREKTGGNALGYKPGAQQWFTMLIDWTDEADDVEVRGAGINITNKWLELSRERGLANNFLYMNDASRDQNPLTIASYGADNLGRLNDISKKYDPERIFQTLQNSGFLLSKSEEN